jgi:hypothetical protein
MKAALQGFVVTLLFLMATQTVKAQAVITEYLDVKKSFSINLNDKKIVSTIYTKGVIDVEWNEAKRILAVSYDPKQATIETIVATINSTVGINSDLISINNKTASQFAHTK